MARISDEEILDRRETRRLNHDAKMAAVMEKREAAAAAMIGWLTRDGNRVFYIWPQGGRYREGDRHELIAFLIRNRYA